MDTTSQYVSLWTQHARRIFAYICTIVPNRSDADDLFQETSLILWEKFDQFAPDTNFYAWACRIAFLNVCNFRRRKQGATVLIDDELLELLHNEQISATESESIERQLNALADCYGKLSPVDQDLISRRYRDGATIRHVAEEVGRPVEGLYKAMHRIHNALFNCIQRRLAEGERE